MRKFPIDRKISLQPRTRVRLNFAKWFGDNGPGCLWATKITRFFPGFICEIWPSWRVYISHIKPRKNLVIFVAHRHPGPLSPNHLAKFKRPRVLNTIKCKISWAHSLLLVWWTYRPKNGLGWKWTIQFLQSKAKTQSQDLLAWIQFKLCSNSAVTQLKLRLIFCENPIEKTP